MVDELRQRHAVVPRHHVAHLQVFLQQQVAYRIQRVFAHECRRFGYGLSFKPVIVGPLEVGEPHLIVGNHAGFDFLLQALAAFTRGEDLLLTLRPTIHGPLGEQDSEPRAAIQGMETCQRSRLCRRRGSFPQARESPPLRRDAVSAAIDG